MSVRGRFRAGMALAWYLAVGFGLPLVDGLWYHSDALAPVAHVESSDAQCHRGECSLESPGAPQSPAGGPLVAPSVALEQFEAASSCDRDSLRSRSIARAHAPRAPPQFT